MFVEIQIGKEIMYNIKYRLQIGETATCTNIMMESTKGVGYRDMKVATNDYFIF